MKRLLIIIFIRINLQQLSDQRAIMLFLLIWLLWRKCLTQLTRSLLLKQDNRIVNVLKINSISEISSRNISL